MAGEGSDELLSTEAAAGRLGVDQRTLRWASERGEIPFVVVDRKHRYRPEDLDAYLERQRVQPGSLGHLFPQRKREPVVRTPRPPRPPVEREPVPRPPRVPGRRIRTPSLDVKQPRLPRQRLGSGRK